jgi:hypothetical protein
MSVQCAMFLRNLWIIVTGEMIHAMWHWRRITSKYCSRRTNKLVWKQMLMKINILTRNQNGQQSHNSFFLLHFLKIFYNINRYHWMTRRNITDILRRKISENVRYYLVRKPLSLNQLYTKPILRPIKRQFH